MSARREEEELADALDALVRADSGHREAMLGEIAEREPARAAELRALLAVLPDPELGDASDASDARHAPDEPAVGDTIGGCVLESVLGRGGIGTVFAARQLEPPRAVAVKILRSERARPRDVARFRAEATALARLEHPAIARLYASGIEPRGARAIPFIVMERVPDARDIIAWWRDARADARVLALQLATVCDALQHGHNRGIVHSDLKPSNILVDGDGRPRVIDFGIARLASSPEHDAQEPQRGALVGTPAYMAPEQIGGAEVGAEPDIDARVDIHAIGLILYEALLGRRAYEVVLERPLERPLDARRFMHEFDPPIPHRVDSRIPVDLSAVTMKAMAKDREKRYLSMSALAADLRAFADGRAVAARPETGPERLARFLLRYRLASTALAIAVLSLVAAVVLSTNALGVSRRRAAAAELVLAMAAASNGNIREATSALERIDIPADPVIRGMIERMLDDSAIEPFAPSHGHLIGAAISPDGSRWAAGGDGGGVFVVDAAGRELGRARLGDGAIWALAFSPDGGRLFAGDWMGSIFEIDLGSVADLVADHSAARPREFAARQIASVAGLVRDIVPSRDGTRLLALSSPLTLSTIDLATGVVRASSDGPAHGMARSLAWNGEGRAFAAGFHSNIGAFDVPADGAPTRVELPWLQGLVDIPAAIGLSRDGALLAVANPVGVVHVVDAQSGEPRFTARVAHEAWSIDFSHDGTRVAVSERGGGVHEFLVADGTPLGRHGTLSPDPAWAVAYAPDGSLLANIGLVATRFSADRGWATRLPPFPRGALRAAVVLGRDGDAPTLRTAGGDGSVWDLDIARGLWRELPLTRPVAPGPARFDPEGARLAAWSDEGIEIVPLEEDASASRARIAIALPPRGQRALAWDPAGDELTVVSAGETTILRDDGTIVARATVEGSPVGHAVVYDATRRPVVFVQFSSGVLIHRDQSGAVRLEGGAVASSSRLIRLGTRWALPSIGGPVRITSPGGFEQVRDKTEDFDAVLVGHTNVAFAAALAADGRMLATAGADTRIRFWDLARKELLVTAMICERPVQYLEWLDGGSALLAIDAAGEVFLLDSVPRRTRLSRAAQASMKSPAQASTR